MMVQKTNKTMSEMRMKKKPRDSVMEKAQDIDLDAIFNTLKNVNAKDADEEFEEVPASSSFMPVPAAQQQQKTMKKGAPLQVE